LVIPFSSFNMGQYIETIGNINQYGEFRAAYVQVFYPIFQFLLEEEEEKKKNRKIKKLENSENN